MAYDMHQNTYQKLWKIYQNTWCFSDDLLLRMVRIYRVNYSYNSFDNIIEINGISYNIQWKNKHPIIVDNNRNRTNTLPPTGKLAKPAITSYLVHLTRKGRVEQDCFS